MINFKYKKEIEDFVFKEYVEKRKSPIVAKLIYDEIVNVPINDNDESIKKLISHIKNEWGNVATNFYDQMEKFYDIKIFDPDLTCFLTRLDIFPYSYSNETKEKWFSAPLFGNPASRIGIIMHELCHYFQPIELPRDIKEAIPVILNDHDKFQMYGIERGHDSEEEQRWRKIIWEIYQKGGNFKDVLKIVESEKIKE